MSNREATRDAWFRLLREASSAAGRSSGLQRDDFGSTHILQDPGKPASLHRALPVPAGLTSALFSAALSTETQSPHLSLG